jgi:hypothetical protein
MTSLRLAREVSASHDKFDPTGEWDETHSESPRREHHH